MKKIIAVIITAIIVLSVFPLASFAWGASDLSVSEDQIITSTKTYKNVTVSGGCTLTIKSGKTMTVKGTMTLGENAALVIEQGAALKLDGGSISAENAALTINGTLMGSTGKITFGEISFGNNASLALTFTTEETAEEFAFNIADYCNGLEQSGTKVTCGAVDFNTMSTLSDGNRVIVEAIAVIAAVLTVILLIINKKKKTASVN